MESQKFYKQIIRFYNQVDEGFVSSMKTFADETTFTDVLKQC